MIKKTYRLCVFLSLIFWFSLLSVIISVFIKNHYTKREMLAKLTSTASRVCLDIFNIRIFLSDPSYADLFKKRSYLVVSNHLSYLDIVILSSLFPTLFITSVEIEKTFLLGTLCKFGGSLFVERRRLSKLVKEIDEISEILWQGHTVTLFPEGTSSNGDKILPFKSALFTSAKNSFVDVLPVCIQYMNINDKELSHKNRDLVCYYGEMNFFRHFFDLLSTKSIDVSVKFLTPIPSTGKTREELAQESYGTIVEHFKRPVYDD